VADVVVAGRAGARRPGALLASVGVATAFVSCWLSNTATAALMTPMALGIADARRRASHATGLLLMVAYAASIGGMATLVGTPPNLLTAGYIERLAGVKVSFAAWLVFGLPLSAVLLVVSIVAVRIATRGGDGPVGDGQRDDARGGANLPAAAQGAAGDDRHAARAPERAADAARRESDPALLRRGARLTIAAFLLAGALWMLPAIATLVLGADAPVTKRLAAVLPESGVALLSAALLFVAPVDWRRRRFALSWTEGRQVDWGILILFGGGLSLGTLAESTGVARAVGGWLHGLGLARTESGFLLAAIALTVVVSEFASNTAAASLLVPLVIATAQASGFDPVRPALAVGMAATCGFMFPVSSPPNAIVYGTGRVPLRSMIPLGAVLDLVAIVTLWIGFLVLAPFMPR
jgi:sodium-dependent dicarboxylate transporter 2/3/5